MAQLKDSIINGSLRVTDTIFSNNLNLSSLTASYAVVTDASKNLTSRAITDNITATAVTASTNLITANTLYYHKGNSNIVTVGTITSGTWSGTEIAATKGGTGQTAYTVGDILYCGTANTLSKLGGNTTTTRKFLRSVATTAGTAVAPAWDTVTKTDVGLSNVTNDAQVKASLGTAKGDMLYWSANATPARLAIGTAGYTLQATANGPAWTQTVAVANGGTGVNSHTANRLVWSSSATAIQAANHYASATQVSIASTDAPTSGYTLRVNGYTEIKDRLLIASEERNKEIYFSNGTLTSRSTIGRISYDAESTSGNDVGMFNFLEYSYTSTAHTATTGYYENYHLPRCTTGLSANVGYEIITTKVNPIISRRLTDLSSASINDITTPGIYSITGASDINNSTLPSNGSGPYYGMLMVFGGIGAPNGTTGNVAVQIYYGNTSQSGEQQYLYIRSKYAGNWRKWHQITLTKLSI